MINRDEGFSATTESHHATEKRTRSEEDDEKRAFRTEQEILTKILDTHGYCGIYTC